MLSNMSLCHLARFSNHQQQKAAFELNCKYRVFLFRNNFFDYFLGQTHQNFKKIRKD